MKKKIVIVRFGAPLPLKKEFDIIEQISGDDLGLACFVPLGESTGIISFVYSEFEPAQIAELFKQVAESTNDVLPVIVGELDKLSIDLSAIPRFTEHLAHFERSIEERGASEAEPKVKMTKVELSLDELLDLVAAVGVENLTDAQYARLKFLSQKF